MEGSFERVSRVFDRQKPDRAPVFDLLPNDAILQYFNEGAPVAAGDDLHGVQAIVRATDGTRVSYFSPAHDRQETLPDGRRQKFERWTIWTSQRTFSSPEEYRQVKKKELAGWQEEVVKPLAITDEPRYRRHSELKSWFGNDYYFLLACPHINLMSIYGEVGLEFFSFVLFDAEDIVDEQLERNTAMALRWVRELPVNDPFPAVFIGDDIAFNNGPMVSPVWLREHYFPRLGRVIDALHRRGKKVMFHSDGNLNLILDDLVNIGIDALNPIDVNAGMDLKELHRRYPKLIFAGGIDVIHLLPFGTPKQIKEAVVKAIEDTEGQILVGSSTEVSNNVPLENFLALREAAMSYRY
ncbi:MAG: uroporphyrinogen decarboxylase family protein [Phycisphaerae bacterium]